MCGIFFSKHRFPTLTLTLNSKTRFFFPFFLYNGKTVKKQQKIQNLVKFDSFLKRKDKKPVNLQQKLKIFYKFRDFFFSTGFFYFSTGFFISQRDFFISQRDFFISQRDFLFLNGIICFICVVFVDFTLWTL